MSKTKIYTIFSVCLVLLILVYSVDFKINSKIFISRQINKAFNKRMVGDCEGFNKFLVEDSKLIKTDSSWYLGFDKNNRYGWIIDNDIRIHCLCEKSNPINIIEFEIKNIEYSIGDSVCYANIEITRSKKDKKIKNIVPYQLVKIENNWKIVNENGEYLNSIINY